MTEQTKSDTPIYDELMAKHMPEAAERIVDLPPPASALGSQALQETQAAPAPQQIEAQMEKKFLSATGYSSGAKFVVDTINNALLDGTRAVNGKPFLSFLEDHRPYITAHEYPKLKREVQAI